MVLPRRCAFTIIELLVSILVVATLSAVAFPVFSSLQDRASSAKCLAGVRQAGAQLFLDIADNNFETPDGDATITFPCGCTATVPPNPSAFSVSMIDGCPFAPPNPLFQYDPENEPETLAYGLLDKAVFKSLPHLSQWYLACSDNASIALVDEVAFDRHPDGVCVFFANGSAQILSREEIPFP